MADVGLPLNHDCVTQVAQVNRLLLIGGKYSIKAIVLSPRPRESTPPLTRYGRKLSIVDINWIGRFFDPNPSAKGFLFDIERERERERSSYH